MAEQWNMAEGTLPPPGLCYKPSQAPSFTKDGRRLATGTAEEELPRSAPLTDIPMGLPCG